MFYCSRSFGKVRLLAQENFDKWKCQKLNWSTWPVCELPAFGKNRQAFAPCGVGSLKASCRRTRSAGFAYSTREKLPALFATNTGSPLSMSEPAFTFGSLFAGVGGFDLGGGSENLAVVDLYNQTEAGAISPTVTSAGGIPNASGPKVIAWNGDETPKHSEDLSVTLRSQQGGEGVGVAYCDQVADPICPRENRTTPNAGKKNFKTRNLIAQNFVVRKLTPTEACRLQGFPDDWNAEQELPDGTIATVSNTQRHKQMGNAVAVPVAEWLGRQIAKELKNEN